MIWNSLKHYKSLVQFCLEVKLKKKRNIVSSSGKIRCCFSKVMSDKRLCPKTAAFKNTSRVLEVLALSLLRNLKYSI